MQLEAVEKELELRILYVCCHLDGNVHGAWWLRRCVLRAHCTGILSATKPQNFVRFQSHYVCEERRDSVRTQTRALEVASPLLCRDARCEQALDVQACIARDSERFTASTRKESPYRAMRRCPNGLVSSQPREPSRLRQRLPSWHQQRLCIELYKSFGQPRLLWNLHARGSVTNFVQCTARNSHTRADAHDLLRMKSMNPQIRRPACIAEMFQRGIQRLLILSAAGFYSPFSSRQPRSMPARAHSCLPFRSTHSVGKPRPAFANGVVPYSHSSGALRWSHENDQLRAICPTTVLSACPGRSRNVLLSAAVPLGNRLLTAPLLVRTRDCSKTKETSSREPRAGLSVHDLLSVV